jgi:hypothetical protein
MNEGKYGEVHWTRKHNSKQEMWMESIDRGSFCGLSTVQWELCETKILIRNQRYSNMHLVIRQKMALLGEAVIP